MIKRLVYDLSKILPLIFFLLLLLVALQLVYSFFKTDHSITYSIRKGDIIFNIQEDFHDGNYYLKISDENHVYHYENRTDFNKQEEILDDIMVSDIDGYRCIYPIYQQVAFDKGGSYNNISCSKDGVTYMGETLANIISLESFQEEIRSQNEFVYAGWGVEESKETIILQGRYYRDYLLPDFNIVVWDYRNLINLSVDYQSYAEVSDQDIYENEYGTLVGQYYVMPIPEDGATYKQYKVVDLLSNSVSTYNFSNPISTDSYVNGVVEDKLYLFDRSNLVQYEINPQDGTVVNTLEGENVRYFDGENWFTKNVYEMKLEEIHFGKDLFAIPELQAYHPTEIVESSRYYYLLIGNQIYKFDKEDLSHPVILLTLDSPKELKVVDDYLFYIDGTTLYYYEETIGVRPIFLASMFHYTYHNVYDVYRR